MRAFWRSDVPLRSHADWRGHLDKKNRRAGTSAPTLATAWAGPVELCGALRRATALSDITVERVVVESQATFDQHGGGRRNHDLVLHGRLAQGDRVVVCVEAKAGEDFGPTVEGYRRAAERRVAKGERSNAPQRLSDLLADYLPHKPDEECVRKLRYQLLSALAGTEAAAARTGAQHAVLMLHEFITDQRPGGQVVDHERDLRRFVTTVFDREPPGSQELPWCFEVPPPKAMAAKLYLARAVTDLRTDTLER